jgi:endoglucanase
MRTKPLKNIILAFALLFAAGAAAASGWPLWDDFRAAHERDGRIVDRRADGEVTTSEGQSYGLFFALAAGDRESFERIAGWTEKNLSDGSFTEKLPAWLWGKNKEGSFGILDSNNASDSDMWIAYALLEAGRLWQDPKWTEKGRGLLKLLEGEIRTIPNLGAVVLPGAHGFEKKDRVVLNPSYYPTVLMRRFAAEGSAWQPVVSGTLTAVVRSSPDGFAPDWADFTLQGDLMAPKGKKGSWDAIRTYLWAGFLPAGDPDRERLTKHFENMIRMTEDAGLPPVSVDLETLKGEGAGPAAFGAALLAVTGEKNARYIRTVLSDYRITEDAYYKNCLVLFGLGYDEGVFSFDKEGRLLLKDGKGKRGRQD